MFGLLFVGFLSSCNTYKNVPYFTDLPATGSETIKPVPYTDPVIQPDDLLAITVQTIDAEINTMFDVNNIKMVNDPTNPINKAGGYLVDKNGDIELPFAGKIRVGGLTRLAARDTIYNKISLYFKNPTVDVRFANFKVTVIGEVLKPGTFTVPNEKVTLFDALGLAGDLTVYGKRENVVLVRDSANEKKLVRLNLNSKEIISSPYFYLKQNDVVYVEPSQAKAASLDAARTRTFTIIASALSVLIVLATRL